MRSDYGLYTVAIICFFLALIFFVGYAQEPPACITGGEVTDLVIMMFSAILGIVFIGLGYGVRPKKVTPSPPKPATAKSKKKLEKKAVKKRRPRKKT